MDIGELIPAFENAAEDELAHFVEILFPHFVAKLHDTPSGVPATSLPETVTSTTGTTQFEMAEHVPETAPEPPAAEPVPEPAPEPVPAEDAHAAPPVETEPAADVPAEPSNIEDYPPYEYPT